MKIHPPQFSNTCTIMITSRRKWYKFKKKCVPCEDWLVSVESACTASVERIKISFENGNYRPSQIN